MRIAVSICLGVLVAGCNMVTSDTPLFSSADMHGQAQFRSGVWMSEAKGCVVDTAKPMGEWPDCADAWVVHPGEVLSGRDAKTPASTWQRYKTLLVAGDPAVLQVELDDESGGKTSYAYAGVKPLKTDAEGRIVEYKLWLALCGPPPKPDPTSDKSAAILSDQMFAGLVATKDKQDCIASAQGPVRAAVAQSEALNGDNNEGRDTARWIRDGDR
jgi:hypothetical protein